MKKEAGQGRIYKAVDQRFRGKQESEIDWEIDRTSEGNVRKLIKKSK